MSRLGIGTATLMLCLTLTAPAHAQSTGNGLYEPFPRGSSIQRAERFVNRLDATPGAATSTAELERGAFRGRGLQPADQGAASARATGITGPSPVVWVLTAAALLAIALAAAARTTARRPA